MMHHNGFYNKPDLQALRQTLYLTGGNYLVYSNVTNHYNEKGRPDSKIEAELKFLSIIPDDAMNTVHNQM